MLILKEDGYEKNLMEKMPRMENEENDEETKMLDEEFVKAEKT